MKHDSSTVRGVFNGGESFDTKAVAWAPETSPVPALNYKNQLFDFFPPKIRIDWLEDYLAVRRTGRAAVAGTQTSGQLKTGIKTLISGFVSFNSYPDHFTGNGPRGVKNASHLSLDWLGAVFVRIFGRERAELPRGRRDEPGSDPWGRDSTWIRSRARVPQVQQGKKRIKISQTHRSASSSDRQQPVSACSYLGLSSRQV